MTISPHLTSTEESVPSDDFFVEETTQPSTKKGRAISIPWSNDEDHTLLDGIRLSGYGRWSKIVQTHFVNSNRTPLQLKNRARHVMELHCAESDVVEGILEQYRLRFGKDVVCLKKAQGTKKGHGKKRTKDDSDDSDVSELDSSARDASELIENQPDIKNDTTKEFSPEERSGNAEFFSGSKRTKTPEVYSLIKEEILHLWESSKPAAITRKLCYAAIKAQSASSISSIFRYLEERKLINNATSAPSTNQENFEESVLSAEKHSGSTSRKAKGSNISKSKSKSLKNTNGTAKPSKHTAQKESDLNDQVVNATETISSSQPSSSRKPTRRAAIRSGIVADARSDLFDDDSEFSMYSHDQFCLVQPTSLSPKNLPFHVEMQAEQFAFVDFHSHLLHTEVIGLLGGRFDEESGILSVRRVFPCESISTGTECEMDPLSELEASGVFARDGLEVVGWYHSHPVFQPDPSLRDIETQYAYQQLVTEQGLVNRPFVGLIVSPYDKNVCCKAPFKSSFRMIWVENEIDANTLLDRRPVNCSLTLSMDNASNINLDPFVDLYRKCQNFNAFVSLRERLPGATSASGRSDKANNEMTRGDKMKCSLVSYFSNESVRKSIRAMVDELLHVE